MLKTHNKYRSLSLLLTLGVVVGQLFPVLADDELPTVETIPETEEFDSSGNLGTDDNNGFGEDFGDENPDNDGFGLGSDDQEPPEVPVTTPEPSAPPVNNSGANSEPPASTEPGENDSTEPVTDPSEQQPQPVTLTGNAEDGKIKVETTTTTTVLPADAFIQADLIKDEQRMAILDGLKDSKYSIDGILPIDIFFLVKNPDSGTTDPIPLPEESTVDLKFSVNKELIHSDKDIDWNSVEVVKVTKNDEGKYEKKTLIENKDLKLVELPVESEPAAPDTDVDQNTEPTEDTDTDTDSDPVQKSEPVQTIESGTVAKETVPENQNPAKPSASSKTEGTTSPETTKETTEFEQVEDEDKVEPADVNAPHPDKSPAEPSQAYQGTVTLDGATQIALTWKNKKSSILDEIKDSIGNTFGSLTEGIKDIFDKLENADLDFSFMNSSSNKNEQDNYGSDDDSFVPPDLKIDKADTKKPDTVLSEPSTQGTDEEPAKESNTVTLKKSREKSSEYDLYTYTLLPDKVLDDYDPDESGSADKCWNGMGKYAIKTTQSATNSVLGTSIPYTDLAEKGYIPDIPTEKDKGYPTISVDGVPYHFDPTGTEATSYQIEWFRLVVANGANTGNNEYNPTVNYGINTYHLDGYIRLRETAAITVDFKVLPPNSTQFSIVGNQDGTEPFVQRIDFDSTDGVSESKVVRPNTANSNWDNSIEVDGVTYVFDGWYRDENFTERATWQATLKSNQTYYGRYVCSTHTLRITNTVTGNMGNQDYPFKYSLEFFDGDNNVI